MISTNHTVQSLNSQKIQQQSKKQLGFFEFAKEFVPYIVIGMTFLGLSDLAKNFPAEKVVWVVSKTFEGFALATIAASGLHFRRLCMVKPVPNQSLIPDSVNPSLNIHVINTQCRPILNSKRPRSEDRFFH